ncbi:MAG TPA: DUF1990 family protein [Myxococcota bacterium]
MSGLQHPAALPVVFGGAARLARFVHRHWLARAVDLVVNAFSPARVSTTTLPPPPEVPPHLRDEAQLEGDGFGCLLGRQYVAQLATTMTAPALFAAIAHHLTSLVPDDLAAFEKTSGDAPTIAVGDEFAITITGPWDGRVRVIEVTDTAFSFVTLRGHPEAGRIRFAVAALGDGALAVGITSWARCRDAAVDVGYGRLGIGKKLQTSTWTTFLERVAVLAGARLIGRIDVSEQILDDGSDTDTDTDPDTTAGAARDVQSSAP